MKHVGDVSIELRRDGILELNVKYCDGTEQTSIVKLPVQSGYSPGWSIPPEGDGKRNRGNKNWSKDV